MRGTVSARVLIAALSGLLILAPASGAGAAGTESTEGATTAAPDAVPGELIVRWAPDARAADRAAARSRIGAPEGRALPLVDGELVRLPSGRSAEQVRRALSRHAAVTSVTPNYRYRHVFTDDPFHRRLWGMRNTGQTIRGDSGLAGVDIRARDAWYMSRGAPETVVAVIDSAVAISHPDLRPNLWRNPGERPGNRRDDDRNGYVDDVHGWDVVARAPLRERGIVDDHGTHIAGTIAAVADNGRGVAGIAPNVRIMSLRVVRNDGTGNTADAVEAIRYAAANGADIANLSWAGSEHDPVLRDAIRRAGLAFVAAAGNVGGNNDRSPTYPASYDLPNLISATAVDNDGELAPWANYGAMTVDVGAPGVDILSTVSGGAYAYASGTSMAAPHVTATLALLESERPTATPARLIDTVRRTARPLSSLAGRTTTGGMVDAASALEGVGAPRASFIDIQGTVFEAAIEAATAQGVAEGYSDDKFRPYAPVSRAQMASFLTDALALPPAQPTFSDVPLTHTHAAGIGAVSAAGIAQGYRDGTYGPSDRIDRGQMATFLMRGFELPPTPATGFADVPRDHTHRDGISAVAAADVASGYPDGTYRPSRSVSRGQMAQFLTNAMARSG